MFCGGVCLCIVSEWAPLRLNPQQKLELNDFPTLLNYLNFLKTVNRTSIHSPC